MGRGDDSPFGILNTLIEIVEFGLYLSIYVCHVEASDQSSRLERAVEGICLGICSESRKRGRKN